MDRIKFDINNEKLKTAGKKLATGERVLMGITKASLKQNFSSAAFSETTESLQMLQLKEKLIH